MKKNILLIALLTCTILPSFAQRKKDLIAEIEKLRQEITVIKGDLNSAQKKEKISQERVKVSEQELSDLRETNSKLLQNISSFTTISKQKADNLGSSLESLKEKDRQLNTINKAISTTDSTKLAVLTAFKGAISSAAGNEASIGIQNGIVTIVLTDNYLFEEGDTYVITEKAKSVIEGIAKALNNNPDLTIIVEGNSNAIEFKSEEIVDNWDLSAKRATSVIRMLQNDFEVAPKRLEAVGKSEYNTDKIDTVTRISINPKFDEFYTLIKENMKNAVKE